MTLVLAACGGGGDTPAPKEDDPPAPTTDVPPEEEPKDEEPEEPAEPEPPAAIPLQCGDSIDNDNFKMTFDSVELLSEYSYQTSEYSSTSLYVENGYKLVVVKGHFENKGTSPITDSSLVCTAMVNDTFAVDENGVRFNFIRDKYFEIDPYTDLDYVMYINIPEKLAGMFETVTFTIGFNDDLSIPSTVYSSDGTKTTETDQLYALTSGTVAGGDGEAAPAGGEAGDAGGEADGSAPAAEGIWAVDYYVDDFEQPTDEWYITTNNSVEGNFSNSATTKSRLNAQIAVDKDEETGGDRVAIFLWEYGRIMVKNSSEQTVDEYNIIMRTADGSDHDLTGTMYCGGDRLFIDDSYVGDVIAALKESGTVSFRIVDANMTTSTYLFSIETSNFGSVYDSKAS
ncbi:MAG: hypothetical protein K2P10_01945 [Oscillospiraceae bacterium]|nr:hypothetical protein [Oscillospiraceae bacterium]